MSTDPSATTTTRRRERILASALLLFWFVLAGRLIQLFLSSGSEFAKLASRQRIVRDVVAARPGEIVDRHGHVFATSATSRSVFIVPAELTQAPDAVRGLARTLQVDPDRLIERIAAHPERRFLWVKRRISDDETERVRALGLPAGAWGFREEFRRVYPQGATAAHVIGLRDIDGHGRGGVEETFDALLRGADGQRELVQDARGRVLEVREVPERRAQHGRNVVLSLDAVIQVYAEQALDDVMKQWQPHSACAIVLDPQNGDVLAMASRPTFDPNHPAGVPPEAWKNRAIADIYEPGSTFKPFVVAVGLQGNCLERDAVFDCEHGEYHMGRRVLHDHHPYGRLSVTDILVKSSNIGMAKIGQRMGNAKLRQAAVAFGFGGPTGIELPGELTGIVRPLREWNSYSTGSVPMGQEVAATPLQIIAAYGSLSNGGRLISPHVTGPTDRQAASSHSIERSVRDAPTVDRAISPTSLQIAPRESSHSPGVQPSPAAVRAQIVSQAVDPAIAEWLCRGPLTEVVARGTGKKAAIPGYAVFGKTGTAQKPDPATGLYSRELHVSSFVCGAPADNPRALVLISVDEPTISVAGEHFGGSVAAPAAGELLRKTLLRLKVPADGKPAQTAILVP